MTPQTHAQWLPLDFQKLLAHAAFINMDSQNSILDPSGCLKHEGLWKGARDEGGTLANTLKLAAACRKAGMPFVWLRYDRFIGETEPTNEMDRVQYHFWNKDYLGDRARKALGVRPSAGGQGDPPARGHELGLSRLEHFHRHWARALAQPMGSSHASHFGLSH